MTREEFERAFARVLESHALVFKALADYDAASDEERAHLRVHRLTPL
jgi:hypothetical protein